MKAYPTSTVFMLAPQRHGSNKTQSMLSAQHPDLYGPYPPVPRQAFMRLASSLGQGLTEAIVHNANLSPRPLTADGSPITVGQVKAELEERGLPEDTLGISIALTHLGAASNGKKGAKILCKSPDNLDVVERFKDGFQDTAFIHLIRDPRAVWNSGRGTPRGPQTPHAAALKWADYHARVQELAKAIPLITLKYEELMLRPETELKKACDFLGIPFHTNMLEDHASQAAKDAASMNPGLWGNLAKPVMLSRVEAWKDELPEKEISIIENSCREVMATYGYEPTMPEASIQRELRAYQPSIQSTDKVPEPRAAQLEHLATFNTSPSSAA